MTVTELTTANFKERVLDGDRPFIVDFYADWCGPCKQVGPVIEQLAVAWTGEVDFGKVNVDAQPEIASAYRVSSIPAILRFEGGEVTHWCIGAKPGYVIERELRLKKRKDGEGLLGRLLKRDRRIS